VNVGDNLNTYDCDGTPFEHGVNVIVIPTERFTETLLHRHLETGTLEDTALYHPDRYVFEFVSNDRDGTIDEANSDVDFFFMRRNISPEDAMEVLELVLKGLVNESVDESNNTIYQIGWINDYVSTKLNGTKATEMNLPYSVLGYIPWFNTYQSSKMGPEPQPDGGFNLILWLLCMTNPILNNAIALLVSMTGIEIFAYLKDYCENVFMNVLTAVGDLVWTLIRSAIYVFAYVLLAIMIINILLEYIMYLAMIPFILMFGGEAYYGVMSFEYILNDLPIKTETTVTTNYVDYFDIDLPLVIRDESMDNTLVSRKEETLGIGLSIEYDYGYPDMSDSSDVYTSSDGYSTLSDINVSPNGGDTQTVFAFTITYTDTLGRAPKSGFPKLHVSNENWVEDKRSYTMQQSNPSDTNYADGKEYFLELSYDKIGIYYFYFEVETPTDLIETDQYQLSIEDLSFEEILTSIIGGVATSMVIAAAVIGALGAATAIPKAEYESLAAIIIYAAFILVGSIILGACFISDDPLTPYWALGCAIGFGISAILFAVGSKWGPNFKASEKSLITFLKVMVIVGGALTKSIFGSITTLFDIDNSELLMLAVAEMSIQFTLLILACWFSGELIFGSLNAGAEDTTKMISLGTMVWLMGFGLFFLLSAFA